MTISLFTTILVPILAGAGCLYFFMKKSRRDSSLRKTGVRAEGVIFDFTGSSQDLSTSSSSGPYPVIRFVTQSGEWITREYSSTHSSLKQGDKVTVYYDDVNPSEFYVEMGSTGALLPAILVLGIVGIGFGLYNLVESLLH